MKKNIYLTFLGIFIGASTAFCQLERPYIPGSPNASSLVKTANVDVGYYTGVSGTTIPLYELTGSDVKVPISLTYNGAGVKVQEVAAAVGLGWNLVAGGAITRVVRGKPDGSKPACQTDGQGRINSVGIWDLHTGACDGEKDMFYYSVLGRTGKVYLDATGVPRTMPYADLEISPGVGSASIGYWKIVDEHGYIYYFGETASTREDTKYYTWDNTTNAYVEKETYTSTWYLNKVMSPKGFEVATLSYQTSADLIYEMYSQKGINCATTPTVQRTDVKIQILQPKYVNIITTSASSATFEYGDRLDQGVTGARVLKSISIKDDQSAILRKFHLNTDYFACEYGVISNCRLRLSSIGEGLITPVTTHSFTYNEVGSPSGNRNPSRANYWEDYWGYYNHNTTDPNPSYRLENKPAECSGMTKTSNAVSAQTYILKEINYAAGSKTVLEYESNSYAKKSSNYTTTVFGAGLRIKSISQQIGSTVMSKSTFAYSGGQAYEDPVLYYTNSAGNIIRSSNSYKLLSDANGTFVGYTTVTETFLDGSKIIRNFYNKSDFEDDFPQVKKMEGDIGSMTSAGSADKDGSPFVPYSSNAWLRGNLRWTEVRDNANNVLTKEVNDYSGGTLLNSIWNAAVDIYQSTPGNYGFYVGEYMLRSQVVKLNSTTSYIYDQTDWTKARSETTTFTYHTKYRTFPSNITRTINGSNVYRLSNFVYSSDLTGSGTEPASPTTFAAGVWELQKSHIITAVERYDRYRDGTGAYKLIGAQLYKYQRNTNSKPLLHSVYSLQLAIAGDAYSVSSLTSGGTVLQIDPKYRVEQQFNYNSANGTVSSVENGRGILTSFVWGYNNSYVTAKSNLLGSVEYKTQYEFNTVNGVTSITDQNNQVIKYEYDNFARFKLTRDNLNNITSRNRYNTKTFNEFTINLAISRSPAPTGQNLTFSSTSDAQSIGTTKYVWDYGDGQVAENATPSSTHTYGSPGSYTVKLAKVNSEYGSIMTTKSLTIYQAVALNTSVCVSLNLCTTTSCLLSATASGGCSSLNYVWSYKLGSGSWTFIGTGQNVNFSPGSSATYDVKCVVSDNCSNTVESIKSLIAYKSPSNCF